MTAIRVIDDVTEIERLSSEWDALAAEAGMPLMSADHVSAWWRHLAPQRASPRIVTVHDAEELIGVAPFYVVRGKLGAPVEYRLPGAELGARISPVAHSERSSEVTAAVAQAFATMRPKADLIVLPCLPVRSGWPEQLQSAWPGGRLLLRERRVEDVPLVSLRERTYDDWLAGKSANFRGQMRRLRRRFLASGGRARTSTPDSIRADIQTFMRLHGMRWAERGGSNLDTVADRLPAMLEDVGVSHLNDGRFRMWILEMDGKPISAQLFGAIGDHVTYLNGGWDERYAQHKPPMLAISYAIEEAFMRNERELDLGPGAQPYKLRFSDSSDPVSLRILMANGRRLPATWARTAPRLAGYTLRDYAKRHLSTQQIHRGRSLWRRCVR